MSDDLYSPQAEQALDALQVGPEEDLYNAVLEAIDHILDHPQAARAVSPGLRDLRGEIVFGTAVMYPSDPRWHIIWNLRGAEPYILGVGPLPRL